MSELIDALNQLQKEKHIEKEVIMQAIEDSLVAAVTVTLERMPDKGKHGHETLVIFLFMSKRQL